MIYYCYKCRRYYLEDEMAEKEEDNHLSWICPKCESDEIEDRSDLRFNERTIVKYLNQQEQHLEKITSIMTDVIKEVYKDLPKEKINKIQEKMRILYKN